MSMLRTMKNKSQEAVSRIRTGFRGLLSGLLTGAPVQFVQVKGLAGETLQDVELFQQFGFTSGPPADTQLIILPLGGKTTHNVIVATENGAYRIKVEQGETSVYNQWGAHFTLKKERLIHMECDDFVGDIKNTYRINCTKAETNCEISETTATTIQQTASDAANYNAPALAFGGKDGETATATMNANLKQNGWIESTGDHKAADFEANGIRFLPHVHPENDYGGPTGPPQ